MNILIISKHNKIPALQYGGTERVIWYLGYELSKLNHNVSFLVKKGSSCNFANVIIYDESKGLKSQIPENTDIIHSHNVEYLSDIKTPSVFTLHGNTEADSILPKNTICISKNHAERNNLNTFVYNGLNWDDYNIELTNSARSYYHFLGKATWKVKNLADAAKIAVKTNNRLIVLGGEKWNYKNLKKGFIWKVNPLIKYHGMVNDKQKMAILSKSKGLIFTVKWHEPFGLAIIESLFAGCPIFGSTLGSLPELITDDVGVTSDDNDILIEAIKHNNFNPKVCRDYAYHTFNSKQMAKNYIKLYENVLNGEALN
ncbi:glycosyltransferase [uncultured Winogradskyella sp.]|uniref:glycosyltransferase n=1 Tax=uncultured Winogradskyella sp. TaxID=395353 RepID=UPI0030DDC340|tara:strand:- start:2772 stop:3710 length:939 start_codon:yes stop_codon:yes gene_type:complete